MTRVRWSCHLVSWDSKISRVENNKFKVEPSYTVTKGVGALSIINKIMTVFILWSIKVTKIFDKYWQI